MVGGQREEPWCQRAKNEALLPTEKVGGATGSGGRTNGV